MPKIAKIRFLHSLPLLASREAIILHDRVDGRKNLSQRTNEEDRTLVHLAIVVVDPQTCGNFGKGKFLGERREYS